MHSKPKPPFPHTDGCSSPLVQSTVVGADERIRLWGTLSSADHALGEAIAGQQIMQLCGVVTSRSDAAREFQKKVTADPFDVSRVALDLRRGDLT